MFPELTISRSDISTISLLDVGSALVGGLVSSELSVVGRDVHSRYLPSPEWFAVERHAVEDESPRISNLTIIQAVGVTA